MGVQHQASALVEALQETSTVPWTDVTIQRQGEDNMAAWLGQFKTSKRFLVSVKLSRWPRASESMTKLGTAFSFSVFFFLFLAKR